jgi:branched-chain amino acid transport system permease protein
MIVLGLLIERLVLRPLVNQPQISLFMATIGLSFFIEGLAQLLWGANVRGLELGIQDEPIKWLSDVAGINVSKFDLVAAGIAAVLVAGLGLFFSRTRIGRALRAVADDHQAALAVGIPLQQIWGIVWAVAGFVALVAGHAVGCAQRRPVCVDVRRVEGTARADPRGLRIDSGRDRRRPHHRCDGKARRGFSRAYVGGGIEGWFPYVLALLFLLVRPEGLFGEKIIRRI